MGYGSRDDSVPCDMASQWALIYSNQRLAKLDSHFQKAEQQLFGKFSPGSTKKMELGALVKAQAPETGTQLKCEALVLYERKVGVSAELEVGPFLINLLLHAIYDLLDFPVLDVSSDQFPSADGFGVPKFLCASPEDVVGGSNLICRSGVQLIFGGWVTARDRFSLDGLVSGAFDGEGSFVHDLRV